jgi:hypothetical protein
MRIAHVIAHDWPTALHCDGFTITHVRQSAAGWLMPYTTSMDSFQAKLSPIEFADLNERFPPSQGSNQIGKRAMEIVKIHFRRVQPGCAFVSPVRGADLAVVLEGCGPAQFEIKGTADVELAWQQLKVSSKSSHDLLTSGQASVLRVTSVYGEEPVVFEVRCGRDFRLDPEPRWCFRPMRGA